MVPSWSEQRWARSTPPADAPCGAVRSAQGLRFRGVHSPEQPLPQPPRCLAVVPLYSLQTGPQICPFSPPSVSVHVEPARQEGMRFL